MPCLIKNSVTGQIKEQLEYLEFHDRISMWNYNALVHDLLCLSLSPSLPLCVFGCVCVCVLIVRILNPCWYYLICLVIR